MSIETRISRLVKKTGVKKSRWTVPLSTDPNLIFNIRLFCPGCPILTVIPWLSYPGCLVMSALSQLSLPVCLFLAVYSWLSIPGCPVLAVMSYCRYSIRDALSWQSFHGCFSWLSLSSGFTFLGALRHHFWLSFHGCLVMYFRSRLSAVTFLPSCLLWPILSGLVCHLELFVMPILSWLTFCSTYSAMAILSLFCHGFPVLPWLSCPAFSIRVVLKWMTRHPVF
jgi:hypothetical protein